MQTATTADPGIERRHKAVVAGVIGNVLEWFDFAVYGYFVPTISQLFFPSEDPLASTLLTFAVFGVGFVMRPIGSIAFGIYGDRFGRRRVGRLDLLHRRVRTRRPPRLHRVLAAGQRRRRIPARLAERGADPRCSGPCLSRPWSCRS